MRAWLRRMCLAGIGFGYLVSVGYGATVYVAPGSASDGPGDTWTNAYHTIQDAVNAAVSKDTVLVSNGVYSAGGKAVYGSMTNRIAIDKAITVKSVNGPDVTVIEGAGPNGAGAVRCVYLGTDALLVGFTLTNGHTRISGDIDKEQSGGGVWCEGGGVVSNCVITGNRAFHGGGSYYGTLNNCALTGNSADAKGGGSCEGTLNNCMLSGNQALQNGGGSCYGTLNNCTLTGDSADSGGGSYEGTRNNCIIWGNSYTNGTLNNYSGGSFSYCCTTPLPTGTGNIASEPVFVDVAVSNFHLQATSPCINVGNNAYVSGDTDLAGNPRIIKPNVDMGAYEYIYSATDYDGDRISNSDEDLCNTDPLDPDSVLQMEQASVSNRYLILRWPSASGALYTLESSHDLTVGFTNIVQHISGAPPQNVYQVSVLAEQPRYYRVKLEK